MQLYRHLFLFLGGLIIFSACKKEEVNIPETAECKFSEDYSSHPKAIAFQNILDKYRKKGLVGISLYVKQDGTGIWQGSAGMTSIEKNIPLSPCHLMYSASVGKIYCATAIMLLVEAEKIKLDDKIEVYLDASLCAKIPNGRQATVRQLLNHTAGIPNVDDDLNFGTTLFNNPYSLNTEKILSFVYHQKPIAEVGLSHHYSSTGYELLAKIIDKVTNKPHIEFYRENIFKKIQLNDTYYKAPYAQIAARLPNNYFERFGNGKLENISKINYHLQNELTGSDGIIASMSDYGLFLEKLLNAEIVSSNSLKEMQKFIPTDGSRTVGYGLGLRARNSPYGIYIGHGGRSLGAGMDLYFFPQRKTTICLATNVGTYVETPLVNEFSGALWSEVVIEAFK
jgi:D-alanyl-D-alanine carboxypeptidase